MYCEEPKAPQHGGYTLSTNSTRFGTVAEFYCSSPLYVLAGPQKITCLKDGSYNDDPPTCRLKSKQKSVYTPTRLPDPVTESTEKIRRPVEYVPVRGRPYLKTKKDETETTTDVRTPYRKIKKKVS